MARSSIPSGRAQSATLSIGSETNESAYMAGGTRLWHDILPMNGYSVSLLMMIGVKSFLCIGGSSTSHRSSVRG